MYLPESAVVIDASSAPLAASDLQVVQMGAFATATLCDMGVPAHRIDLSRLPRAALFDGFASDRITAAGIAVRDAEFVAIVADARAPEALGLVKSFLSRIPVEALRTRPVLVILATDRLSHADGAARAFRATVIAAGTPEVDVAIVDSSRDGFDVDLESLLASRLARAISPAEAALAALQTLEVGQAA